MNILSTTHHTVLASLFCVILSSCVANPRIVQAQNENIEGNTLRFVAGEFRGKWTSLSRIYPEDIDLKSGIEDRFPFVTDNKLLFLETGQETQRVFVTDYDQLVNIPWGFLAQNMTYPPEQEAPKNWWEESPEIPTVIGMYQSGVVLEEDIDGQRLKSLYPSVSNISTTEEIRDYLKIQGKEWIVYSNKLEMRQGNHTKNIFQCDSGVFSVDIQNDTIAVGYKDSKLVSSVCVLKADDKPLNKCQCKNTIKNATNPLLSQNGQYLAVASFYNGERWDLRVGPITNFPNKPVINGNNINFYDIKTEKVFYQNSYTWGGNTLIFSKGERDLYKVTCQNGTCGESKTLNIPENISVCGIKGLVMQHHAISENMVADYIEYTLKWKDNQPLWFQAASNCPNNDVKKYQIASVKWGQAFFIGEQPYLATESRLKFMGNGGKWIARILVFAIE